MRSLRFSWFLSVLFAASTCVAQNPVPFIGQPLVPAAAEPTGPGFTLTVNGAGFVSGSIVNWNGTPLVTTFVSAGKLTAVVPAGNVATSGTARVTVVNPSPGGGSSDPAPFTITYPTSTLEFRSLPVGGSTSPIGVVTADFNHDGIPDLAVIDQAPAPSCNYQYHGVGSIEILQGNGDGTFFTASTLCLLDYLNEEPTALALTSDLNRDGNIDLISVSSSVDSGHVAAYYGNGNGTFSAPQELGPSAYPAVRAAVKTASTSLYQQIKGIALGDFYRNGQLNVAESQTDSTGASYVFLLPENNFLWGSPAGAATGPLVAADFKMDGILDLADNGGSLKTFLDNGSGTFTEKPDVPFGDPVASIAEGDFNGDGIPDLVSVHGDSISVLLGNGDGTFTAKTGQPVSAQTNVSLIAADFNGDGKLDLAVVDSANTVSVWLGNGNGTFQAPVDTTGRGDGVASGDFDGDGQMDLAVSNSVTGTVSILLQGSPYVASVEPPIDLDGTSVFSARRWVLPVRFTLAENGVPTCSMPPATIAVTRTEGRKIGPLSERIYATPSDKGSNFRIDRSSCQYVYRLATASMGSGKYRVDISLDGVAVGHAVFTLRADRW